MYNFRGWIDVLQNCTSFFGVDIFHVQLSGPSFGEIIAIRATIILKEHDNRSEQRSSHCVGKTVFNR